MSTPPKPKLPWDQKMANDSAVITQCEKLGGVVVKPASPKAGFGSR